MVANRQAEFKPGMRAKRRKASAFGKQRYSALGVAREDWEARQRAAIANWDCFGASAALFCYIDRELGLPQWADVGMYLQTVMLLLRAEGLHSCPQMAGRRCARPWRMWCHPGPGSPSSVACRSGSRTSQWIIRAPAVRRSVRPSPSSMASANGPFGREVMFRARRH